MGSTTTQGHIYGSGLNQESNNDLQQSSINKVLDVARVGENACVLSTTHFW